jgi:hypothetical protein
MEEVSRRIFFKQAGAAAAVAAVATGIAVTPVGLANAVAGAETTKVPELSAKEALRTDENLVAHVKDARSGEISLFIGQKEVTIHDRQIVTRLIRATR